MIERKRLLIYGLIIYFIATLIQLLTLFVLQSNEIISQNKTAFLFLSSFIVAFGDVFIIKSLSKKLKIIKVILLMHATVAFLGSIIFFIYFAAEAIAEVKK